MSSIYITEPPTKGKVLLKTTLGDIDIELWSKEAPLACRNFIQLCLEEYYNDTIFHRVVFEFVAQGGDPTGTGEGGESVYGSSFKDEFHQRLKFNRRGLVGMANGGKNDNGSQFFITLGRADELNNKNTLFGKVAGNTLYNLVKFNELSTDNTDRPLNPPMIFKTEVLHNPFTDIVPRESRCKTAHGLSEKIQSQSKATKNFSLLSFGEEAEEEEEELNEVIQTQPVKIKSSHDVLRDPTLVSDPALTNDELNSKKPRLEDKEEEFEVEEEVEDEEESKEQAKVNELKLQAKMLSKEIRDAKRKELLDEMERRRKEENLPEAVKEIREVRARYMSRKMLKKGGEREISTMDLLTQFRSRLDRAREEKRKRARDEEEEEEREKELGPVPPPNEEEDEEKETTSKDKNWLMHQVTFDEEKIVLAKDAMKKDVDYYDIYDPRNPLNERRRQEPNPSGSSTASMIAAKLRKN